ncbi:CbtA family protein [Streptomyces meridianus]|uniref:CbtA family protein n=1 Tax=Streptomyces meridianus TaxID=2938945 RepID=A0ABT0X0Z4_9ACTN|nr:CbtA family protein [Streptomyces meridianus]MCM2576236.1 CbtA family protein [Streptomyces meridianus]
MDAAKVRALLVRGMLAGAVAGLFVFVFAYVVGEPPVDAAVGFEEAHGHGHGHGVEAVSRAVQSTAGLATAVLAFGTATGGIGALVFCFALGRIGRFGARATAALTAFGVFVTVHLVPFLKYPGNPPAVGDPDTIGKRTALFFLMIALTVLLGVLAVLLGRRLAARWGNGNATVTATGAFVLACALAMAFLPSMQEVPDGFPAALLWQFRLASIGVQALQWAAFGAVFGVLAERLLEPGGRRADGPSALRAAAR